MEVVLASGMPELLSWCVLLRLSKPRAGSTLEEGVCYSCWILWGHLLKAWVIGVLLLEQEKALGGSQVTKGKPRRSLAHCLFLFALYPLPHAPTMGAGGDNQPHMEISETIRP